MNLEELRRYEWINFYDCRTNIKDKKAGAKVGKYLAVSGYDTKWKIYQTYGGIPILDVWITSLADAVKIAQVIDKEYNQYLGVWEVYPDWEVLGIARFSVPNGEAIYDVIHELEALNRPINYNDFETTLNVRLTRHST